MMSICEDYMYGDASEEDVPILILFQRRCQEVRPRARNVSAIEKIIIDRTPESSYDRGDSGPNQAPDGTGSF